MRYSLLACFLLLSSATFAQQPAPPVKVIELTDATLAPFLQANPNVLLVFYGGGSLADMNSSMATLSNVREAVQGRTPAVAVGRLSIVNKQSVATYHVQRTPALRLIKQGKLVVQADTYLPAAAITNMLNSHL